MGMGMDMESHSLLCFILLASAGCCLSRPSLHGVHPLDEKYYSSEVIKCKDGSKSFSRDHLNDNFCDCPDGTDEPGTSACPTGKFYCRNLGSKPQFIFSSHVNDNFCDCCDGSDEYEGTIHCPNTCVMGGNSEYMNNYNSKVSDLGSVAEKETKNGMKSGESVHNLTGNFLSKKFSRFKKRIGKYKLKPPGLGLRLAIILQVVLVVSLVFVWSFRRRTRSRRRRYQ